MRCVVFNMICIGEDRSGLDLTSIGMEANCLVL